MEYFGGLEKLPNALAFRFGALWKYLSNLMRGNTESLTSLGFAALLLGINYHITKTDCTINYHWLQLVSYAISPTQPADKTTGN